MTFSLTDNLYIFIFSVGEHETELSFEPNQIITNGWSILLMFEVMSHDTVFPVRPSLEPGWLEGILDGRVGLVPENYVEFVS